MAKAFKLLEMVLFMMDTFKIILGMEKENIHGLMDQITMENGTRVKKMVREFILMKMVMFMLDYFKMILGMAKENVHGLMDMSMK